MFPILVIVRRIDSLMRFFIYLLLFWLPYSSAVVESCVIIAFLLWLAKRALLYRQKGLQSFLPPPSALNLPIGFFLLSCLLTTAGSAFWEISLRGFFTKTLEWFVVYFLILEVFTKKEHIMRALGIFVFSALATALYSLGQFYLAQKEIWIYGKLGGDGRATALFHTGNELGGYLVLLIPLAFSCLFLRSLKERWYALFTFVLCVLGWSLAVTISRAAWISVLAGLFFYLLWMHRKVAIIFTVVMILLAGLYFMIPADFKRDFRLDFSSLSATASGRLEIWKDSARMIADRPLFGHGLNTYMRILQEYRWWPSQGPTYAHNCYIQIAAEVGVLGLLGFLWILGSLFQKSLKVVRQSGASDWNIKVLIMGWISGILAFLLHAFVDTHFYSLKLVIAFWAAAGLLVSLSEVVERKGDS